ncbi:MAG: SIR2 family protein, partial [Candidatus Bathyarchaeota archaeon]|nr:SIR2 family protein [Candidatus Bathyarchaeota archaeon]
IYKLMVKIPSLFITTNYDKHFSDLFVSDRVVFNELDMDPYLIDNEKLYHIHGHIDDQEEIVLTLPKYMGRYNNDTFQEFLSLLFGTKTILFIGYGLSEFEVLDFLFTKNKTKVKNTHFILMPYYEGNEDIVDFDQHYFNELGIKIIPYKKDELGYDQLYAILDEWSELIKSKTSYLTKSAKFIDEVVGSK